VDNQPNPLDLPKLDEMIFAGVVAEKSGRNATTPTPVQTDNGTFQAFSLSAFFLFKRDRFREKKAFGIFLLFQ